MARYIFVISASQALTSGALDELTTIGKRFRLLGVYLHADGDLTDTITITKDALAGSAYDTVLAEHSLSAETDYVFRPTGMEVFVKGDEIQVDCTNATTAVTVYLLIYYEEF